MEIQSSALSLLINTHKRLSRDSLITPYKLWCDWVHSQAFTPKDKWRRILDWKIDPSEYSNPRVFKSDWQLNKLLSKFSEGGCPTETEKAVAREKFLASEERCKLVNIHLRGRRWSTGLEKLLPEVQKIVANVLGDLSSLLDSFDHLAADKESLARTHLRYERLGNKYVLAQSDLLSSVPPEPEFGPGMNVGSSVDGNLSTIGEKIVLGTITHGLKWAVPFLRDQFGFPEPSVVNGDVLTYAPKRVGEARAICPGPSVNLLIQKHTGLYMKKRLKAVSGIDLRDQSKNASMARLGSLCDSYCTVDMSSASDLFAIELVRNTLPHDWFMFLDSIRSHQYNDDGEWKVFEKFSAMGNGFTFELESLLFAAILRAAVSVFDSVQLGRSEYAIFGDDLIFPKEHYHTVVNALTICGHIPNMEKSFAHGPFRESCGGDYFHGWNVTPFKIKEVDLERPTSVVNVFNGIVAAHREDGSFRHFSSRVDRCLSFIKGWLVSRYPRLSEGPVELTYSDHRVEFIPTPSNRWLWSPEPQGQVYSYKYQTLVPKYTLEERLLPASQYSRDERKNVVLWYDVDPVVAGYYCQHGGYSSSIWTRKSEFKLNDALRK